MTSANKGARALLCGAEMCPESLNRMKPGPRTEHVPEGHIVGPGSITPTPAASANEAMAARVAPSCCSLLTSETVASQPPRTSTRLAAEQSTGSQRFYWLQWGMAWTSAT